VPKKQKDKWEVIEEENGFLARSTTTPFYERFVPEIMSDKALNRLGWREKPDMTEDVKELRRSYFGKWSVVLYGFDVLLGEKEPEEYCQRMDDPPYESQEQALAACKNWAQSAVDWTLASAVRLEADNQAREMMGWRLFMG